MLLPWWAWIILFEALCIVALFEHSHEQRTKVIALKTMLIEAHDKWEFCLKEVGHKNEHISGLQAALRTEREWAEYRDADKG